MALKNWKSFNESISISEGSEHDLKKYFDVDFNDLREILSDIIDFGDDMDINISLNVGQRKEEEVGFDKWDNLIISIENDSFKLFDKSLVISRIKEIQSRLRYIGLDIFHISRSNDKLVRAVNLFICSSRDISKILNQYPPKKEDGEDIMILYPKGKYINESNKTEQREEELLKKYFDLDSSDIEQWLHDFLDEHPELRFEVSVINHNFFIINLYADGYKISKKDYEFTDDTISFLQNMMGDYNLTIEPEPGSKESGMNSLAYYSINGTYISFRVVRNSYKDHPDRHYKSKM